MTKGVLLVANPSDPHEFISPELELPRSTFEFKLVREAVGQAVWESLPYNANHKVDLTAHGTAHIRVQEGEELVLLTPERRHVVFHCESVG